MSKLKEELQRRYDEQVFRAFHELIDQLKKNKHVNFSYQLDGFFGATRTISHGHRETIQASQALGEHISPAPTWIDDMLVALDKVAEENGYTRGENKDDS